jgi:predicted GNAT family acetyltransferase
MDGITYNIMSLSGVRAGSNHVLPLLKALKVFAENCEGCGSNWPSKILEEVLCATINDEDKDIMAGHYDDPIYYEAKAMGPRTHILAWLTNTRNEMVSMAYVKCTLDVYTITYLYTPPGFRGQGFATHLTRKLFELNDHLKVGFVSLCIWTNNNKWCEKNGWLKSFTNYSGKETSYVQKEEHREKLLQYVKEGCRFALDWLKKINKEPTNENVLSVPHAIVNSLQYISAVRSNSIDDIYEDRMLVGDDANQLLQTKWCCKATSKELQKTMGNFNTSYNSFKKGIEVKRSLNRYK